MADDLFKTKYDGDSTHGVCNCKNKKWPILYLGNVCSVCGTPVKPFVPDLPPLPDEIKVSLVYRAPDADLPQPPEDWNNPEWKKARKTHEWKNYISEEVQKMWYTFTELQQRALARQAEGQASIEDWD